ncbi:MAG: response regulator [Candidatus Kapaibacterium sp.]|nr:MAG: response regulator [Candidatus Kapabacteria bacterium]
MKILVVDDNEDMRLLLMQFLKNWGHDVVLAQNGAEAWHILEENDQVQFVVSDWNMPLMDGIEFCRRLREDDYFDRYVYVILLTARRDQVDLVEGMEAGADDFMGKPFNKEELRVRIRAGERVIQLEKILEERNKKLREAQESLQKDLRAAASLQKSLLPDKKESQPFLAQGYRYDWLYVPAAFIGGDSINFLRLDNNHAGFYIVDVAGHGIPSAMTSVMLHQTLSAANGQAGLLKDDISFMPHVYIRPPAEALYELNNASQNEHDAMNYFTMMYGVMDVRTSHITLAQAGHPPAILLRANGSAELVEGAGGVPIGMLPDMVYDQTEITLNLNDRLFFYTDGITECENRFGEQFSQERLIETLTNYATLPLDEIIAELAAEIRLWRGSNSYDDDITLFAIEKCAEKKENSMLENMTESSTVNAVAQSEIVISL